MYFVKLLKYVETHTKAVVGHYGEGMYAWEIMNEAHDWANELQLTQCRRRVWGELLFHKSSTAKGHFQDSVGKTHQRQFRS